MKRIFWIAVVMALIWACAGPRQAVKVEKNEDKIESDSVEYGLETFDAKFETWYMLHNSPASYRSQSYYEHWNQMYVQAWNARATSRPNSFFEPIVGYFPDVDYGFELNHELFYYFQYVENVLRIEILHNGPKGIVL